jgi:hypothetical protein
MKSSCGDDDRMSGAYLIVSIKLRYVFNCLIMSRRYGQRLSRSHEQVVVYVYILMLQVVATKQVHPSLHVAVHGFFVYTNTSN